MSQNEPIKSSASIDNVTVSNSSKSYAGTSKTGVSMVVD